jgi:fatty-acyl-CoA synthase
VWERFAQRFAIPKILEFYAATEANFSLFNCEGRPGSIGRIPGFLAHRFPIALVKFDATSGTPARGADGFCIRCGSGEIGEAIGQIASTNGDPGARFEGYTDREASEAKVLRNVFSAGDAWYRTGDLMRKDQAGFFYFVDRVGDTFRWKGENVSTLEVAEAIMDCPGVNEAIVYGVAVAGAEGRAGMAAIVPGPDMDLTRLRSHLKERLPDYAVPLFLRISERIETTGTFKMSKQLLVQQGFDPSASADTVYFNSSQEAAFVAIDPTLFARLQSGSVRI